MALPRRLGALALVCACNYPNARFNGDGDATASAGTANESTTTTTSTSTSTTSTTSTTATTAATTTTAADTTTTDSTTGDGSSSGTTGQDPVDCWGQGADGWTVQPLVIPGPEPVAPRISPDGLDLLYTASYNNFARPYFTSRASVLDDFPMGLPITNWALAQSVSRASLAPSGIELVMDINVVPNVDDDLFYSVLQGDTWSAPTKILGLNSSGAHDQSPKIFGDGTRLYFHANRGPLSPLGGEVYRIYESTRADASPGTPFAPMSELPIVGLTDDLYPHFALAPVPTEDGLRLFYSTSYPNMYTMADFADALEIFYTVRDSVDDPWTPGERIEEVDLPGSWVSPDSVTADGCILYYRHWGNSMVTAHVATRTPGP